MMKTSPPRLFTNLAFITALLTAGLIVFGAVVRVTDSGLGCGNHWPLCDGRVIPPLDNLTAWIEWSHRLFAVIIGLLGLPMLFLSWRHYRTEKRLVFIVTMVAAGLYLVQSMLGRMVVVMDLPPTAVTLHLGTGMLLLAALLLAGITAWHEPKETYTRDHVTLLAYITLALSFVVMLAGGLVRGSGATLACTDWPLCNGSALPFDQGRLQIVHMMHRYSVVALGITLVLLLWYIYQTRSDKMLRTLSIGALALYFAQAVVGAIFVATEAAPVWGATHVGLAAATWAVLVALSAVDTLNSRQLSQDEEWNTHSEAALS